MANSANIQINYSVINEKIAEARRTAEDLAITNLATIGEKAVQIARELAPPQSYHDQTGALRSSIGYAVYVGKECKVGGEFVAVSPTGKNKDKSAEGIAAGKELLNKLSSGLSDDSVTLIVVAGMKYAVYVEDIYHKDVLTSAALLAKQIVPQLLYDLDAIEKK